MSTLQAGEWGQTTFGRSHVGRRRAIAIVAAVLVVALVATTALVASLWRVASGNIEKIPGIRLDQPVSDAPLNVLVVGSDSRDGLTPEQIQRFHLGTFEGARSDTVLLVSIARGRDAASVVSFPRDLAVDDAGERRKLTETFAQGPEHVVDIIRTNFGVPVHHYVEVSILGFVSVVEAVGGVRICLEEPLQDDKSGADFPAGCIDMDAVQALQYVRSRQTARGDFDRIERQQTFMRALLDKMISTRVLVDVPRLFNVVEQVSRQVKTDDGLGPNQMRELAQQLKGLASGAIPMSVVPSYTETIEGTSYVVAYPPGASAMFAALAAGEPLPGRGTQEEREATDVVVWSGGDRAAADLAQRTLFWASFDAHVDGAGPLPPEGPTVVYALPGHEPAAGWVAATLGTTAQPLPTDVTVEDADVVVRIGVPGAAAPAPTDPSAPSIATPTAA